ncbi:hypothetical protein [Streptomyces shaanxiensis]|uniref:YD repeat-containing protein n=1 Tax=Streptomyces shaanxiensis TaxID=653357 RepID=A0ABP7UAH7_9ACTN
MYREFVVPDDQEILETIGEWPGTEEESGARHLTLQGEENESITFSYDALARSVRVRWKNRSGEEIIDVFREGATCMKVHSDKSTTHISLDFHMGECSGRMEIRLFPSFAIKDHLLFT